MFDSAQEIYRKTVHAVSERVHERSFRSLYDQVPYEELHFYQNTVFLLAEWTQKSSTPELMLRNPRLGLLQQKFCFFRTQKPIYHFTCLQNTTWKTENKGYDSRNIDSAKRNWLIELSTGNWVRILSYWNSQILTSTSDFPPHNGQNNKSEFTAGLNAKSMI